jgi:hypothetical protein
MTDCDKEKTAFACHKRLFEWNVIPFGLSGALSVFSELMSIVLEGLPICVAGRASGAYSNCHGQVAGARFVK